MTDQPGQAEDPLAAPGARDELRRKLEAMAAQADSPAEAQVARRKLRELDDRTGPDPRSFSERYRATPYSGVPVVAPPPVAAPARRVSIPTRLLFWAGVLILAAGTIGAVALGASLLTQRSPTVLLASIPPPTLRPSPTPTPGLPEDATILDRFIARLMPGHRSYRVAATTTVVGAGRDATIELTGSVSDTRWSGSATVTPARGAATSGRMIRVGKAMWYRIGTSAWRTGYLPINDVPEPDPFVYIESLGDLVYLGPELHGGAWTYHLATRQGWVSLSSVVAGWRPGWQFNSARMDIWADRSGAPIEADYVAEIGITDTATRHSFTTTSTYLFSHVGDKITISPP